MAEENPAKTKANAATPHLTEDMKPTLSHPSRASPLKRQVLCHQYFAGSALRKASVFKTLHEVTK
jgi:hypothetical protein